MKYLEVKVVKVKPKLKVSIIDKSDEYWQLVSDENLNRLQEGLCKELKRREKKGNWVNGENLDKIKFPCFCSYEDSGYKCRGILNKSYDGGSGIYELASINHQYMDCNVVDRGRDLSFLIESWSIHILKGKIILFEEDDSNEFDIDIEGE